MNYFSKNISRYTPASNNPYPAHDLEIKYILHKGLCGEDYFIGSISPIMANYSEAYLQIIHNPTCVRTTACLVGLHKKQKYALCTECIAGIAEDLYEDNSNFRYPSD